MKASEYIVELQKLINIHGDYELYYYQDGQMDFFKMSKPEFVKKDPSDDVNDGWETSFVSCNTDNYFEDLINE